MVEIAFWFAIEKSEFTSNILQPFTGTNRHPMVEITFWFAIEKLSLLAISCEIAIQSIFWSFGANWRKNSNFCLYMGTNSTQHSKILYRKFRPLAEF
jgi:hypothetical protein